MLNKFCFDNGIEMKHLFTLKNLVWVVMLLQRFHVVMIYFF